MLEIDPQEILKKYHLKEKAEDEIVRNKKKLNEPPRNIKGRSLICSHILDTECRRIRNEYQQVKCVRTDANCFSNRRVDKNIELCNGCPVLEKINGFELSIGELETASKKLRNDAVYDEANI